MDLYALKSDALYQAGKLPKRYEDYSIDELANNYCKAKDERDSKNKNIYGAALILRFWSKIDKIYQRTKSLHYDRDDVFNLVYKCIDDACYYRAWQDPEKHTNAQACINQVLSTRGLPSLVFEANRSSKCRFGETSLDDELDDESGTTKGDLLADENANIPGSDLTKHVVQSLIKQNKIVEAIIMDNIAYKDVFKHDRKLIKQIKDDGTTSKYISYSSKFWPFKLVQELNKIDDNYEKYFTKNYAIDNSKFSAVIAMLKKANNQKKYRLLTRSMDSIKTAMLD